jgi:FKBP-type peptidyl-prolyl cis-trans isomerase
MRLMFTMLLAAMPALASAQGPATQARPTQATPTQAPAPAAQAKPAQAAPSPSVPASMPEKRKLSYALGLDIGSQFKERSMDIDAAVFAKGMQDLLTGATTEMTPDEARATIVELQKYLAARQAADSKAVADKNKAEGAAFLAANKANAGVVALPSGVQYKVITTGTGKKPLATDTVVCHYRGTLINGTEFDNSYKRSEPANFPVDKVIKGWTEVLQLMPVGSKWQIFVPSDLAYGERGAPAAGIAPHSVLIFEIELVGIKAAK